jgi:heat shock protein HslJ
MRSISYLPQMLTVFLVSAAAAAQSPWGFPVGQRYVAVSLNGQTYAEKAPTITVKQDGQREALAGSGFAGCNTWFGRVTLGQTQFGVGDVGTTKMFCADRMTTERGFLDALKSVSRWRLDGKTLVLEGDRTTLLLAPVTPNAR